MSGVFINYRSRDSASYGTLLQMALASLFGDELVFLDSESTPVGSAYVRRLLASVRECRALLPVIGPRWLTAVDAAGRRIDDPQDWIRRELVEAFAVGVNVVPVLVDGARMPGAAELPEDIVRLERCRYRCLRHRDATADLARIVADLVADEELAAAARWHAELRRENTLDLKSAYRPRGGGLAAHRWSTGCPADPRSPRAWLDPAARDRAGALGTGGGGHWRTGALASQAAGPA